MRAVHTRHKEGHSNSCPEMSVTACCVKGPHMRLRLTRPPQKMLTNARTRWADRPRAGGRGVLLG